MQIWDRISLQIPVPIRTLCYSKPDSGVHMTKKYCTKVHIINIVHKSKFLLGVSVQGNAQHWREYKITLVCVYFIVFSSLQTHMVRKAGARQKMELIYGAGFWSVCHRYGLVTVI